jgi:hypothetical protein
MIRSVALRPFLFTLSPAALLAGVLFAACADTGTNPIPVVPAFDGDSGVGADASHDGASDAAADGATTDATPDAVSEAGPDDAGDAASDSEPAEAGDSGGSTIDAASDGGEDGSLTPADGAAGDV